MRGEVGNKLTLQGDLTYDLSKVYQSLLGYDYIILNQPLLERDAEMLEELRQTFRRFVGEHYPKVSSLGTPHEIGQFQFHCSRCR